MRTGLLGFVVVAASVLGGCGAEDPGAIDRQPKLVRVPDAGQTVTSAHDAGTPTDASTTTGGDAAVALDAGDPFWVGVPAYSAASKPATSAVAEHQAKNPGVVPTGQTCVAGGCHGAGATTKFLFAGTLFTTAGGTTPAVAAEVVLKGGTVPDVTYTDDDGNFWFADNGALPANAHVGVRMATGGSEMTAAVGQGSCSAAATCHGGSQGAAHL